MKVKPVIRLASKAFVRVLRWSIKIGCRQIIQKNNQTKNYMDFVNNDFAPGCALKLYKPELAQKPLIRTIIAKNLTI